MKVFQPGESCVCPSASAAEAYTARAAQPGLLHPLSGFSERRNDALIPYGDQDGEAQGDRLQGCGGLQEDFSSRECKIHFPWGVWDTVSSLGWIYKRRERVPFTRATKKSRLPYRSGMQFPSMSGELSFPWRTLSGEPHDPQQDILEGVVRWRAFGCRPAAIQNRRANSHRLPCDGCWGEAELGGPRG